MSHPVEKYLPDPAEHFAHLYNDYREHACTATTKDELADWQQTALPALISLIGLRRMRQTLCNFEPGVVIINSIDCGDYCREAGYLQAEPDVQLPIYILRPRGRGPFPLAIMPHGHHEFGRYAGVAKDDKVAELIRKHHNDVAVQAVQRGFFAIAMGTRGLCPGSYETPNTRFQSGCHAHWGRALMAGRTSMAERVWDAMKLIDWATDRKDVDDSRVLMIGNSGGGQVTTYTAALDRRVSVAVPNCSFAPLVAASGEISHCICNLVPGIFTFGDYWDVAALIAPRPICFVHGRKDKLFSESDVERAVKPLAELYEKLGASDQFDHHWGDAGHQFYPKAYWPFIEKHLLD